jgi:hypothetical protein
MMMEHVKKWKVDDETIAETCMPCKMQRKMNA